MYCLCVNVYCNTANPIAAVNKIYHFVVVLKIWLLDNEVVIWPAEREVGIDLLIPFLVILQGLLYV